MFQGCALFFNNQTLLPFHSSQLDTTSMVVSVVLCGNIVFSQLYYLTDNITLTGLDFYIGNARLNYRRKVD